MDIYIQKTSTSRSKILVSINGTSPDLVVCLFLWSCGINFNSLVCAWLTTILCFHKVSIYHFMIMFITNIAIVYAWSISDTCFESDTLQYNDYVMNLFDKWREDSPPIYSIMVFFLVHSVSKIANCLCIYIEFGKMNTNRGKLI